MHRDNIRNFIRRHRDAFDTEAPGAHGWSGVEKALNRLRQADDLEGFLVLNRVLLDEADVPAGLWSRVDAALASSSRAEDPLEGYIRRHRDALDTEDSDLVGLWGGIVRDLPAGVNGKKAARIVGLTWGRRLMRAAAAVALVVTGIGLGLWMARSGAGMEMADVSDEYAELERYYQREIASQQASLARFAGSQPDQVNLDLQQLDVVMNELRHELAGVPPGNREQVVRAMIENYETKTAILKRVLERLEQSREDALPSNESNHEDDDVEKM
jgi:hypothetical protein